MLIYHTVYSVSIRLEFMSALADARVHTNHPSIYVRRYYCRLFAIVSTFDAVIPLLLLPINIVYDRLTCL